MVYTGKRILLGVSGGIAVYKAAELARRLVSAGANVKVVMTKAAQEFVTPLTFQALTGEKVAVAMFGPGSEPLEHVAMGQQVAAIVVTPATANFLGKVAAGIGDDLVTTILLTANKPILICPAMNCEMWANAAVQENVARLRARGLTVLDPEAGDLACGTTGYGRLPESETILEALEKLISSQDLTGRKVLVTAGPTHEDLDPVRFLTNRSSGKQGYALAKVAWRRGAEVCLISGPTQLPMPYGVEQVQVWSAKEMLDAVLACFPKADALIMVAAVGDYCPTSRSEHKMKRGSQELTVHLTQNPDILKEVAAFKKKQVVVGFAAETQDLETAARRKLEDKGLDLIVVNEVNRPDSGFAVNTNEVTIIGRGQLPMHLSLLSKEEVAEKVLDQVVALLPSARGSKVN